MSDATCESCGEHNAPYAEFCIACGNYLGWQDRRPATGRAQEAPPGLDPPHHHTEPAEPGQSSAAHSAPSPVSGETRSVTTPPAPQAHRTESPCSACGQPNPPERRFCRKCGAKLAVGAGAGPPPSAPDGVGWRRFLPGDTSRRQARAAYRRSLPARYRVTRVLAGVAAVAMGGSLLSLAGHNPAGWLREQWYAVRGTLEPVPEVTARADPAHAVVAGYLPGFAVDGTLDQAWATTWSGGGATGAACGPIPNGGRAALVLTLPERVTLRGVEVAPGLPAEDPQRVLQWRPRLLQLTYADGSCERVELADSGELRKHRVRAVSTTTVRVEIAAAAPPRSGRDGGVAIGEIRLLCRPGCRPG